MRFRYLLVEDDVKNEWFLARWSGSGIRGFGSFSGRCRWLSHALAWVVGGTRWGCVDCGEMLGLGEMRGVALWLVGGRVKIR